MLSGLVGRGQNVFSALSEHLLKAVKASHIHVVFHEGLEQLLKQRWEKFCPVLAFWLVCFHHPVKCCGESSRGQPVSTVGLFAFCKSNL